MNFKSIVAKIRNFENTQGTVEGLYLLSIRNLLINILLATLVTIALYPILGTKSSPSSV